MSERHVFNSNLLLVHDTAWRGWPLMEGQAPFIGQYLDQSLNVINDAVGEFGRVCALRIDLRFPSVSVDVNTAGISRFIKSLKAKLENDQRGKARNGKRSYGNLLKYIWVKEQSVSKHSHYHLLLLLNGNAYHHPGIYQCGYQSSEGNMALRIIGAWASALRITPEQAYGLVHFPRNGVYHLDANRETFQQSFGDLFYRVSYLAKAETKNFEDGSHHFGCSKLAAIQ